ncbi:MAG: dihydrodipicolinate synthase family protein [Thermoleophilaceae bacterium]
MHFEGVVPAVLTPFDERGEVDAGALARNVEWLLEGGAAGLVGTGTMGEAQSLGAAERRRPRTSRFSWAATTGRSRACAPAPPAGSPAW